MATAIRSEFVQRFFWRWILPALFIALSIVHALRGINDGWIGLDAEIYYRGSAAWLAGTNPWDTYSIIEQSGDVTHYSALPTMTVLGAPMTLLPEGIAVVLVIALSTCAAVYIVRRLRLAWYWLVFPPMVEGVLAGNPSIVVLALLLSASPVAQAVAALLKVYAIFPLLGERRLGALGLVAVGVALSLVAWPLWATYLSGLGERSARLIVEAAGGYSAATDPVFLLLGIVTVLALIRVDWRVAGWLVVPALWPATQFHYSTLALPVMHPILAVGLAFPERGLPVLVIALYAIWRLGAKITRGGSSEDAAH